MPTKTNASGQAGAGVSQNHLPQDYIIVQQFRQEMESYGIKFSGEIIPDGRLRRFHIEGQRRGTLNGAYVLHADGCPAGWFQDYTTGLSQTWSSNGSGQRSYHDPEKLAEARQRRETERLKAHKEAAEKAAYIWREAVPAINHTYLTKKRIQPHGARLYRNALVIPIHNESDRLVNLQLITPEGVKRFLSGGRKRGCFHTIGDLSHTILIAEGFATCSSLHEETKQRAVVAFDAGNLSPVARNIRELAPDNQIIICADNDISGVGQAKATEAALSIGAKVLIPPTPGTDWNDVITGGVS